MRSLTFSRGVWRLAIWLAVWTAACLWGSVACWAGEATWVDTEDPVRFLRLTRLEDGEPKALETAIVRFRPTQADAATPAVDLISAIHVGEPEYYAELNRIFSDYDAVLYELVAPEGARIPQKGAGRNLTNPVSLLQSGLTDLLDLQFQLEGIDYTAGNLVHADMSPEQFARSMRERGESFGEIFIRMMGYTMARQNDGHAAGSDARMMAALLAADRAMALRRIMAEQFSHMQGAIHAIEGPGGSTLIAARNKVALDVLRRKLDAGKRKVAIFYGAGHMDDILARLCDEFDLEPAKERWLTAWKLR